ncbi:MAG: class I SAM-dependent methyltransferase [Candidatus Sungiibacteriota bacterium]
MEENSDRIGYPKNMLWYYFLMEILFALDAVGALEVLKRTEKMSVRNLAQNLKCNEKMLEAMLTYLWLNTPFLKKTGDEYGLSKMAFVKPFQISINFGAAYRPVFANLAALLKGELVYGKDINRDGSKLQLASLKFTESAIPAIMRGLSSKNINTLVDLGCGSAELLIRSCEAHEKMMGIGVDIDPQTVAVARENVLKRGLRDRITIVECDLRDIEKIRNACPAEGKIAFSAVGILHEILRDGDAAVVKLINEFKRAFPDSTFFVAEFNALSPDELRAMPDETFRQMASCYQLIHPLSLQGDPRPVSGWKKIFTDVGAKLESFDSLEDNFVLYTLAL